MRQPIAFVEAVVRFPLYDGDKIERDSWTDFVYEEPGIHPNGDLGVCRRDCVTVSSKVFPARDLEIVGLKVINQ